MLHVPLLGPTRCCCLMMATWWPSAATAGGSAMSRRCQKAPSISVWQLVVLTPCFLDFRKWRNGMKLHETDTETHFDSGCCGVMVYPCSSVTTGLALLVCRKLLAWCETIPNVLTVWLKWFDFVRGHVLRALFSLVGSATLCRVGNALHRICIHLFIACRHWIRSLWWSWLSLLRLRGLGWSWSTTF